MAMKSSRLTSRNSGRSRNNCVTRHQRFAYRAWPIIAVFSMCWRQRSAEQSAPSGNSLFLLMDLDGLKKINDRFGHLVGNRALCRLAQILADCCRSVDHRSAARRDEFALVLPETGAAAATLVARRICDLLAKDEEEPALSVSVELPVIRRTPIPSEPCYRGRTWPLCDER